MSKTKKLVFNPDAAEEYFSMMLASCRNTANDIFRRDNEGRHASEQRYSAEYQKYVGMQIALREVLEYFGKFDLGGWISVKDRLPENNQKVLCFNCNGEHEVLRWNYIDWMWNSGIERHQEDYVLYWMPLPQPPKGE